MRQHIARALILLAQKVDPSRCADIRVINISGPGIVLNVDESR